MSQVRRKRGPGWLLGQSSYHQRPASRSAAPGHRMAAPSRLGSGYWGLWAHRQLRWPGCGPGHYRDRLRDPDLFLSVSRKVPGPLALGHVSQDPVPEAPAPQTGHWTLWGSRRQRKKGIFLARDPELTATTLKILHALSCYQPPPTSSPVAKATTHLPLISVVSADEKRNLN